MQTSSKEGKKVLLRVSNLKQYFPLKKKGLFVKANDGITLDIYEGETFGLVGESGCGKSTLGRTLLQLYRQTDGRTMYYGRTLDDLAPAYVKKTLQTLDKRREKWHELKKHLANVQKEYDALPDGEAKYKKHNELDKAVKDENDALLDMANLIGGFVCVKDVHPAQKLFLEEYRISSAHCGRIQLTAERCRLYDPFGIIGIRLGEPAVAAMTVQPKGFVQSVYVSPDANCPDDSENYAPDRTGYDLAEVYALREYAPGDSLRQMHWKLSSKLDKLVVREPSLPVRRSVLVFWERTQTAAPEQSDAQADVVVTACRSLLESGVQFTVCWNDAQEQQCVSQPVRSVDELTGLLPRLLSAGTAQGESGAALFCRSSGEAVLSHILYITGRVPEDAAELGRFGRLTILSCGADAPEAITFDAEHYAEQLSELEI